MSCALFRLGKMQVQRPETAEVESDTLAVTLVPQRSAHILLQWKLPINHSSTCRESVLHHGYYE